MTRRSLIAYGFAVLSIAAVCALSAATSQSIAHQSPVKGPTNSEGVSPHDFIVHLELQPPGKGSAEVTPVCDIDSDGNIICKSETNLSVHNVESSGTVKHKATGLMGTIKTVCDTEVHREFVFRMKPPTLPVGPLNEPTNGPTSSPHEGGYPTGAKPQVISAKGETKQRCAWHMEFGDDQQSTLTGRLTGGMKMELIDPSTGLARMEAEFEIEVVDGTGLFVGYVGTGTFGHTEEFKLFGQDGRPPAPGVGCERAHSGVRSACASTSGVRASGDDGSGMALRLRKGSSTVKIVSPGSAVGAKDRNTVQIVAAPGARCEASARRHGRTVSFRTTRAGSNGNAEFRGAVGPKLKSGKWRIGVRCQSGGHVATSGTNVKVG